jgi:bifunctional DNase/RNase
MPQVSDTAASDPERANPYRTGSCRPLRLICESDTIRAGGTLVRVELARIIINERSDEQIIYLREDGGQREFPIVIGLSEAFAIDRIVKENLTERPLTHDLLGNVISLLDGGVSRALIDDLRDGVYFAKLVLRRGNEEMTADCRPSDAITIALQTEAPIYVADHVMNTVCSS